MTVLITGANGQIGRELVKLAKIRNVPHIGLNRCDLDIAAANRVREIINQIKPSCVLNAAAYTAVDRAELEVESAFAVNQLGPKYLAQSCADLDIPLIHISTDYVFDGKKESPYTLEDEPNPINKYGESKLAGEKEVRKYCSKHIILRTSWVFSMHHTCFVKKIFKAAKQKELLRVVDDQTGSPTSARSVASFLLEIGEKYLKGQELKWGLYHYANFSPTTWYEFARSIVQAGSELGLLNPVEILPISSQEILQQAERPKYSVLDIRETCKLLSVSRINWCDEVVSLLNTSQVSR